jgi:hypothetical protein
MARNPHSQMAIRMAGTRWLEWAETNGAWPKWSAPTDAVCEKGSVICSMTAASAGCSRGTAKAVRSHSPAAISSENGIRNFTDAIIHTQ